MKGAGEVRLVGEAAAERDLRQARPRIREQLLGPFHAPAQHVLVGRQPGTFLEGPGEVEDAQAGQSRELPQGERRVQVSIDVLGDAPESRCADPSCQRRRAAS